MSENKEIDILNKNLNREDDPDYFNVHGNRPSVNLNSRLSFDKSAIEKIASVAASQVDGVLDLKGGVLTGIQETFGTTDMTKGVSAEIGEKEAAFDINVIIEYGKSAPIVYENIKRIVSDHILTMTGLHVVEVNLKVVDVMTAQEYYSKKKTESTLG